MSYHGEWYIPYRVAEVRFWGKITEEDLNQHNALCMKLLTEAQEHAPGKRVQLILDALEVEALPPLYLMISRAVPVLRFKNRDTMFVIANKSTTRSILELTAHVMHFPICVFSTRLEALAALEAVMLKNDVLSNV